MSKRFTSGLITSVSILGTAFLAVVLTPQWTDFVNFLHDRAIGWGIPTVVVALIGVFVSEVWKAILNRIKISNALKNTTATTTSLDLY